MKGLTIRLRAYGHHDDTHASWHPINLAGEDTWVGVNIRDQ